MSLSRRIINRSNQIATRAKLWLLRLKANRKKRNNPGIIRLDNLLIHYTDLLSLYMEYKDIFAQGIYDFSSSEKKPCIIDGGACIGMASLRFKQQYPKAEIIAFEPDHTLANVMDQNVAENKFSGVKIVRAGLGSEKGKVPFLKDVADGGRIVFDPKEASQLDMIDQVPLSTYISKPVDFLKLNIEGNEYKVLSELESSQVLSRIKQMTVEFHGWAQGKQDLGAILELLSRNGFRYMLHDFDTQTNSASKPPFAFSERPWFCLIHARRKNDL